MPSTQEVWKEHYKIGIFNKPKSEGKIHIYKDQTTHKQSELAFAKLR